VPIRLKHHDQIEAMRAAGQIVREVLDRLSEMIRPGLTTEEMDAEARRITADCGAECLFLGVPSRSGGQPFPGSICASINEEVVHGIPSADRMLRQGDILSVDFGVRLNGWCGDAARTFLVGEVDPQVHRLVDTTRHALEIAVQLIRPGGLWSGVAGAMEQMVRDAGFSVIEDFVGHGIGKDMHEDPKVPNFVSRDLKKRDIQLKPGLVLAVEPMVNLGGKSVKVRKDGWTVVTADGKPSAHWEHTIAVTEDGVTVLTA
jgi:methionyl aminopeptidase